MFWTRLCTLICTAFFLLSAPALAAGDFPTRTINVINAWLPGGIGEMAYRPVGDELAKILKTNVVLVPSAGAGGLMGVNKALTSRPNGYNLLLTTDASLIGLSTLRKVRWSMDDFIPVGSLGSPSVGLAIRKGDPRFSTFEEFVAYAKAHPGELSAGQTGMLGTEHLNSAIVYTALGIDVKLVPFDGTLAVVAALSSGHVDCTVTSMLYYEGIQPLAGCAGERYPTFPDMPTLKEKGYDVDWGYTWGLFARKGTPPDQVKVLADAMRQAVQSPAVLSNLDNVKVNPTFMQGEEWATAIRERTEKVKSLVAKGIIIPEKK